MVKWSPSRNTVGLPEDIDLWVTTTELTIDEMACADYFKIKTTCVIKTLSSTTLSGSNSKYSWEVKLLWNASPINAAVFWNDPAPKSV